jgi:hypothetical protein
LGTNRGDPADTAAKNEKEFEEERGGSKTYRGRKGRSLDEKADLFLVASCELEVDLRERVGAGAADLGRGWVRRERGGTAGGGGGGWG